MKNLNGIFANSNRLCAETTPDYHWHDELGAEVPQLTWKIENQTFEYKHQCENVLGIKFICSRSLYMCMCVCVHAYVFRSAFNVEFSQNNTNSHSASIQLVDGAEILCRTLLDYDT